MKPNRCKCGRGLRRQPLRQEVPQKIKGRTITMHGRHLVTAGIQMVCTGGCGPVKSVYRS